MKILGIIIVCSMPILIGLEINKGMKKRLDILEHYGKFILFVKENIRCFAREIDEIFALASGSREFENKFFREYFAYIKNNPTEGDMRKFLKNQGLKDENSDLILAFQSGLGKSDIEGELNHCDYYDVQITEQINILYKDFRSKSRLNLTLSISLSLVMLIIIL